MASTPHQGPTWYDILGVGRDATPEQIKAAWRAATDKFEPGSGTGQFRLFNEAADVLLDPQRRRAYDAELAEPLEAPEREPEPEPEREPEREPEPEPEVREDAPVEATEEDVEVSRPASAAAPGLSATLVDRLGARLRWVLVVCVPLVVVSVAVSLVAVLGLDVWKADVRGVLPTVQAFDAGPEATSAAERALVPVLSYDYRHMEADRDRAAQYLTPAYRKDYLKTFDELIATGPDGSAGPAVKTQAVVTAQVLDAGVVDAEPDLVRVIAFVNQTSVKGGGAPTILQNRLVVAMVHRGDRWLIDKITSY